MLNRKEKFRDPHNRIIGHILIIYNIINMSSKYQRGKIYKIESKLTENIYIGSTIEKHLSDRLSKHKFNLKRKITNNEWKIRWGLIFKYQHKYE